MECFLSREYWFSTSKNFMEIAWALENQEKEYYTFIFFDVNAQKLQTTKPKHPFRIGIIESSNRTRRYIFEGHRKYRDIKFTTPIYEVLLPTFSYKVCFIVNSPNNIYSSPNKFLGWVYYDLIRNKVGICAISNTPGGSELLENAICGRLSLDIYS